MAPISVRRLRERESGNALVEFALVLPLLMVIIAGIVDFGFLLQRYEVLTNAAREGARVAVLPGYTDVIVRERVREYIREGLGLSQAELDALVPANNTAIPVQYDAINAGGASFDVVRVRVNYPHQFLILGPVLRLINGNWGSSITISATSTMRLEIQGSGS